MRHQPTVEFKMEIRWDAQVIDGAHYVNEHRSGTSGFDRYGPMTADQVEPLIAERRAYWEEMERSLPKIMQDTLFPQFA